MINRLRWLLRKLLRLLPARERKTIAPGEAKSFAYLFSGTYGDMVQCLPVLFALDRSLNDNCVKVFIGPAPIIKAFSWIIPKGWKLITSRKAMLEFYKAIQILPRLQIKRPFDTLVCNAVSVYNVRSELLSRLFSDKSAGFHYSQFSSNPSFNFSQPISEECQSFCFENLNLVKAAGLIDTVLGDWWTIDIDTQIPNLESAISDIFANSDVIFHVGAISVKNRLGKAIFDKFCEDFLICLLSVQQKVILIGGPEDQELLFELQKKNPTITMIKPSIQQLFVLTKQWQGKIICFDSFYSHLAMAFGKAALVLCYPEVPRGYHCTPIHQEILIEWPVNPGWAKSVTEILTHLEH